LPSDESQAAAARPAQDKLGWGTRAAIIVGAVVLIVPTAVVLKLRDLID